MRQVLPDLTSQALLPLLAAPPGHAAAPAADYAEGRLAATAARPAAMFYLRLTGEALAGAGLLPGDLLAVDPALAPAPGAIVVAALEGELLARRLEAAESGWRLVADDPARGAVELSGDLRPWCWGVAVAAVRPRH